MAGTARTWVVVARMARRTYCNCMLEDGNQVVFGDWILLWMSKQVFDERLDLERIGGMSGRRAVFK